MMMLSIMMIISFSTLLVCNAFSTVGLAASFRIGGRSCTSTATTAAATTKTTTSFPLWMSSTYYDNNNAVIPNKRLERIDEQGRRRSDYMVESSSSSDENYNYRGGRRTRLNDGMNRRQRWNPYSYDSSYRRSHEDRSNYRNNNNIGHYDSWYDGTSFSQHGRSVAMRELHNQQRWRPQQQKEYWYDRTIDSSSSSYGAPIVQGGSRKTFSKMNLGGRSGSTRDDDNSQTVVELGTEGRPLYANIETWEGPDNTRSSLNFYSEDGYDYGVRVLSGSRRRQNHRYGNWYDETVSVRNTGPLEYPMQARVDTVRHNYNKQQYRSYLGGRSSRSDSNSYVQELNGDQFRSYGGSSSSSRISNNYGMSSSYGSSDGTVPTGPNAKTIQGGGATRHWQLSPQVQSVKVELHSQGLPIMARIELLQGPNNVKTLGDVYQEDGYDRPFICVLDTGNYGCYNKGTIQITNDGPMEFPIVASVEAHEVSSFY